ncbi:hypothetical protein BN946_scf185033.g36 [Trametes cinnabarina]|uniref:Uncharacterized protein n=1 Tax=Pycnoporus cinnabarinus TaxID=5643 RepID=A0A060SXA7_PYCCI|nr:hypothetical protein BN946_scf185033.g36 [Trametes cinnabarina]
MRNHLHRADGTHHAVSYVVTVFPDHNSHMQSSSCSSQVSCLCSSSTNQGLYDCLECALSIEPDQSVLEEGQENYDGTLPFDAIFLKNGIDVTSHTAYVQACQQAGESIDDKTLTIPNGASTVQVSVTGASTVAQTSVTPVVTGNTAANTNAAETQTGSAQDPLKTAARNGAGVSVVISGAGVVGAAAAVMAVLAL